MNKSNNREYDNNGDLEALFFGSNSSGETSEDDDVNEGEQSMGLLQDLIVGPDMSNLKNKVGELEITCNNLVERQSELEQKQAELEDTMTQDQKQIAQLVFLKVSKLLEQKLANLKAEIKTELFAELDITQDLSIRFSAVQEDEDNYIN